MIKRDSPLDKYLLDLCGPNARLFRADAQNVRADCLDGNAGPRVAANLFLVRDNSCSSHHFCPQL